MTKPSVVWLATLGLLIAGFAIDRHATQCQLKQLAQKQNALAEAAATAATDEGNVVREPPWRGESAQATPVASHTAASQPSASPRSSSDPAANSGADEPPSADSQVAHIDWVFSEQPRDQRWSPAAEHTLTGGLLPFAVSGSRVQKVECRSSLCKVRVEHTTEEGLHAFVHRAFTEAGYWPGAMVSMREHGGPQDTVANVMYFVKDGDEIPFLQD